MFIHDVCRICGLTKKAVEYYEKQGLIHPEVSENGYRRFGDRDISALREISLLRKLGLGIADIKEIIESQDKSKVLQKYVHQSEWHLKHMEAQRDGLAYLAQHPGDIEGALEYFKQRAGDSTIIKDKLREAFPGKYGTFMVIHFGEFLNDRIESAEQYEAYQKIVDYLDSLEDMDFPEELDEYFKMLDEVPEEHMQGIHRRLMESVEDYDGFMEKYRDAINDYILYRQSEEYRSGPIYRLTQCFDEFQRKSGYYDVFLANMKILSPSYNQYQNKLSEMNRKFLQQYPQFQKE